MTIIAIVISTMIMVITIVVRFATVMEILLPAQTLSGTRAKEQVAGGVQATELLLQNPHCLTLASGEPVSESEISTCRLSCEDGQGLSQFLK